MLSTVVGRWRWGFKRALATNRQPWQSHGTNNGSSIAIGTLSNAAQYGAVAIGIGAVTSRENQIVLGSSTNLVGTSYTFAEANKTTVTVPNLSGDRLCNRYCKCDGTLYRYEGALVVEAEPV